MTNKINNPSTKLNDKEIEELLRIVNTPEKLSKLNELLDDHSTKQKTVNDWYAEFAKAEKLGYFPEHCERSAFNWGCCAIGARIQIENPDLADKLALSDGHGSTYEHGYALTAEAEDLGVRFYDAVEDNQIQLAKKIFNEIHSLPRIFKTNEEREYDKLSWLGKRKVQNPYKKLMVDES